MKLYGSSLPVTNRRSAFTGGEVPVAVYGLGKMGLPLAAVYADVCGNVVGADVDEDVVDTINKGGCHVKREPGLPELVSNVVDRGALSAMSDPAEAAREATVHVIIVPTPIHEDSTPDLSILDDVVTNIAGGLKTGDLVVVESTVPPRTCVDHIEPILVREGSVKRGEFGLAFCPERTSSGRALEDIRGAYPKVVGGIDADSTRACKLIYEQITSNEVITVSDTTTAEAVKVFEGVYRDVNIALANELAQFTDELEIDVNEAIGIANTQPFCDIHTPGVGVGGHCIPYYPHFLIQQFSTDAPVLRTARQVNDGMPAFAARKVHEGLIAEKRNPEESIVLVLGVTYRPGVEETRHTPAAPLVRLLDEWGARVLVTDPLVDGEFEGADNVELDEIYDRDVDAIVLVTAHEEFNRIDWRAFERRLVVVDGRQALDLEGTDHSLYTIGSGDRPSNQGHRS